MLQYLTPSTLAAMYEDLNEARHSISESSDGLRKDYKEYQEVDQLIQGVLSQYEAIVGHSLLYDL